MTKPMPKLEMGSIEVVAPDGFEGIPYDEAIIYIEGHDSLSEIEVRCPGALRLAPRIVSAVNNHDSLVKALKNVQKLISEAAMTGFNCNDGDWAERLFESQQMTSRALRDAVSSQKDSGNE